MKMRATDDSTSPGANEGWAVMTTLLAGFLVWGAIGWGLDRWWGTRFLTPVGLIIGMALGIYAVVARFGPVAHPPGTQISGATAAPGSAEPRAAVTSTAPAPSEPPATTRRETQ